MLEIKNFNQEQYLKPVELGGFLCHAIFIVTKEKYQFFGLIQPKNGHNKLFIPFTNYNDDNLMAKIAFANYWNIPNVENPRDLIPSVIREFGLCYGVFKNDLNACDSTLHGNPGLMIEAKQEFQNVDEFITTLKQNLPDIKILPVLLK